jgi:hypothetical protein
LSEKIYRRVFAKRFDFALFNQAVMDASFIAKSGKKTFGLVLQWRSRATGQGSRGVITRHLYFKVGTVADSD